MKTFRHVLKKDFIRLAAPFAFWLLLLGLETGLALVRHEPGSDAHRPILVIGTICAPVLYWILTIYLSAAVVLEDPPKGTTAFWLTRPLARGPVAAAKLTFLAALAVIPILVHGAVLAALGAGGRILAWASLESLAGNAFPPFIVAAFAVTAETFGQFLINTILILVGSGVVALITEALLTFHRLRVHPLAGVGPSTLTVSTTLAVQLLALAAGIVLVLWRYLHRHARFAVAALAAVSLILMLAPHFWNWDYLQSWRLRRERSQVHESDVQFGGRTGRMGPGGGQFPANIAVSADENGNSILPESLSEAELTWADGDRVDLFPPPELSSLPIASYAPGAFARALAPLKILNLPHKRPVWLMTPSMSARLSGKLADAPATLRAHVTASLRRYQVEGELPLRPGARKSWGLSDVRLTGVQKEEAGATIFLREGFDLSRVVLALHPGTDPRSEPGFRPPGNPQTLFVPNRAHEPEAVYLLANRTTGQALLASRIKTIDSSKFGAYEVWNRALEFADDVITPAWLEQAVLVRVRFARVGAADGSIEIHDFAIGSGDPESVRRVQIGPRATTSLSPPFDRP